MTSSIIDFLEARLAEDEAAARATLIDVDGSGDWHADERPVAWTVDLYRVRDVNARPVVEAVKSLYGDEGPADPLYVDGEAIAAHIARHDPARVLREVAAKRAILNAHQPVQLHHLVCTECEASRGYPCQTLKNLAAIWSDHPDFDPNWSTT